MQLRNGRPELAMDLVNGDFALFSGADKVGDAHGPSELADLIKQQAETADPPAFTIHRQPVVAPARGHVAFLWTAETKADGALVGGVDLLTVRAGRFARAWSLTGAHSFRY
ncbi:hypothetical protein ACGFZ9_45760 [Streptomyces mirabilis]|uniref:hypothetical protein n=1 Tax=Streptomyces mirabilis TaxID=68239 RepID=UPI00371DD861